MGYLTSLSGTKKKLVMYSIEVGVLVLSILWLTTMVRTFGDSDPPITLQEPAIASSHIIGESQNKLLSREVHIIRDITYRDHTPFIMTTELINKDNDATVDLQDTKVTADRIGTFKTHKFYFVSHLTPGNWCIKSTVYWTPFLSLRERSLTTKESCFLVK